MIKFHFVSLQQPRKFLSCAATKTLISVIGWVLLGLQNVIILFLFDFRNHGLWWHACDPNVQDKVYQHAYSFVCLGFFVPLESFSLIRRRWRAANFDLCSALMVTEQWGFFSVPYPLWHGAFVYNGHLRGPATLTPFAERLAMELSPPV